MQRDPYNFDNNKSPLAENLLKSYTNTESLQNYADKVEEIELEKGSKKAFVGEKREFGGRMYIKTTQGWKFFGKGTGTKAKDHHAKHAASSKEPASTTESDIESPETYKNMSDAELEGAIIALEKIGSTALKTDHEAAGKTLRAMSAAKAEMDSRKSDLEKVSDEATFTPKQLKDAAKSVLGALINVSRKNIDIPHSKSFSGKVKDGRGYHLFFRDKEPNLEVTAADFSHDEHYIEREKKMTRIKGKGDVSTFLSENPAILRDVAQSIVDTIKQAAEEKKAPWSEKISGGMSKRKYYSDLYNGFFGKATLNIEHLKEIL